MCWHQLACLLLVVLPFGRAAAQVESSQPSTCRRWGHYPITTDVPQEYVLFNETILDTLDRVASPGRSRADRAVLFTTLRFGDMPDELVLGMISTFCYHLYQRNMLQHTMLITTDERTWHMLDEAGYPAFLDRAFPRREEYVNNIHLRPETDNRVSSCYLVSSEQSQARWVPCRRGRVLFILASHHIDHIINSIIPSLHVAYRNSTLRSIGGGGALSL